MISVFSSLIFGLLATSPIVAAATENQQEIISTSNKCDASLIKPLVPNISILNVTANLVRNHSIKAVSMNLFPPTPATTIDFCNITIRYTHPNWDDSINLSIYLPTTKWNHKLVSTGGGGFVTGPSLFLMEQAVYFGYAAAGTDGGHTGEDLSWVIKKNNTLINYPVLVDFASESLKDMAVISSQVTHDFYNKSIAYRYWSGCSTGGRQGMMMAQRYSDLFDGILANAPAVSWSELTISLAWPQVVLYEEGVRLPNCVLDAFTQAAIKACDALDGLTDGIIDAPGLCTFDPQSIVGQSVNCNDTSLVITKKDASAIKKILEGPRLANGTAIGTALNPGTSFLLLAGTDCKNGKCTYPAFDLQLNWISRFLVKNASFNTSAINYQQLYDFYLQSKREYDWIMSTSNPDLRHLRKTKTKVLTFHGLADSIIPANNTINYYESVLAVDSKARDYYRYFEAPGVDHCGGGNGPNPANMFNALVDWVEKGIAPEQLQAVSKSANGTIGHQPLCEYPLVSAYQSGDPKLASSYKCQKGFNRG